MAARLRTNVRRPASFPQFWTGTTLPAPCGEFGFGERSGLATATIAGESRVAKRCKSGTTVTLNPKNNAAATDYMQFGIAPVGHGSTIDNLRISVDGKVCAQLLGSLPATKWSDIRLPTDHNDHTIMVTFGGKGEVWLSQPLVGTHAANQTGRNIVVLVIDSMRPDEIGLYPQSGGNPTPFIDGFFEHGIRFENAYSQGEWTLPSLSTMMTGTHALQHGVYVPYKNPRRLPPCLDTLATILQRAGYRTYCHSNGARFTSAYEHHRGFERFRYTPTTDAQFGCEETIRGSIEFIDGHRDEPFLCFLHFYEAHPPFGPSSFNPDIRMPPARWAHAYELYAEWKADRDNDGLVQELKAIGKSMVRKLDLHLASLFGYLERSGLLDTTTVILTSDHGREYVPGLPLLTTDRVHVPLVIHDNRFAQQTRTQFVESGLDIMPTALSIAGLPVPNYATGRNLLDANDSTYSAATSESLFRGVYELTLRDADWCYFLRCAMDETTGEIFSDVERDERLFARDKHSNTESYTRDHGEQQVAIRDAFRKISVRHTTRERFFDNDCVIPT